jgi:hypothetical protein
MGETQAVGSSNIALRGCQRLHPAVLLGCMASGKAAYLNNAAG